jgi:hypothetical protein
MSLTSYPNERKRIRYVKAQQLVVLLSSSSTSGCTCRRWLGSGLIQSMSGRSRFRFGLLIQQALG